MEINGNYQFDKDQEDFQILQVEHEMMCKVYITHFIISTKQKGRFQKRIAILWNVSLFMTAPPPRGWRMGSHFTFLPSSSISYNMGFINISQISNSQVIFSSYFCNDFRQS